MFESETYTFKRDEIVPEDRKFKKKSKGRNLVAPLGLISQIPDGYKVKEVDGILDLLYWLKNGDQLLIQTSAALLQEAKDNYTALFTDPLVALSLDGLTYEGEVWAQLPAYSEGMVRDDKHVTFEPDRASGAPKRSGLNPDVARAIAAKPAYQSGIEPDVVDLNEKEVEM